VVDFKADEALAVGSFGGDGLETDVVEPDNLARVGELEDEEAAGLGFGGFEDELPRAGLVVERQVGGGGEEAVVGIPLAEVDAEGSAGLIGLGIEADTVESAFLDEAGGGVVVDDGGAGSVAEAEAAVVPSGLKGI
jgi:hypothetical protein